MSVAVADQYGLDEEVVENSDLEAALEEGEQLKQKASFAQKTYREADEQAKGLLDLEDGDVVRCGRFRVSKKAIPSRSVAFETSASSRFTISTVENDG